MEGVGGDKSEWNVRSSMGGGRESGRVGAGQWSELLTAVVVKQTHDRPPTQPDTCSCHVRSRAGLMWTTREGKE